MFNILFNTLKFIFLQGGHTLSSVSFTDSMKVALNSSDG